MPQFRKVITVDQLLTAIAARRTSFDRRTLGVEEPRWDGKHETQPDFSLSRESIELLAVASMTHSCRDADFDIYYSYGSGLGTNIVAKCTRCGKRYDITDYGSW